MKPDQLYQELKDLAERMQVSVLEQNLKTSGLKVRSGLCTVKGQKLFIMDKHKSVHKKIKILVTQLARIPHEDMYIIPAVRKLLEKYAEK
jgi:NADH:ubiquinone oxidoreductase subunit F (NADH-binding)